MHKLGTLEQFEIENSAAKKADGWTQKEIKDGKVIINEDGLSYTITTFLEYKQNPLNPDEYLWESEIGDIKDTFNLLATWSKSINKPSSTKYYIARKSVCSIDEDGDKDCHLYGEVTSKQVINFGSQVAEIEIFNKKKEYLARINELGIAIEEAI